MNAWNQKEFEAKELSKLKGTPVNFPKQSYAVFQDEEEIDELDFKFRQKRRQQIIKEAVIDSLQQRQRSTSDDFSEESENQAESPQPAPKPEPYIPPDQKNSYFTKVQQTRQSALALVAQKLKPRKVEVDQSELDKLRVSYEEKISKLKQQLDDAADQQQFAVNNIRQQYKNKIENTRQNTQKQIQRILDNLQVLRQQLDPLRADAQRIANDSKASFEKLLDVLIDYTIE